MRAILVSIMLLSVGTAWAQADAVMVNETITDSDLAEIKISVTDIGHPVFAPLQLKITVLCKDNRVNHAGPAPKPVNALPQQAICAWGTHAYSTDKKMLAIKFSEAAIVVGDSPCEAQPSKGLNIKKICARWNR